MSSNRLALFVLAASPVFGAISSTPVHQATGSIASGSSSGSITITAPAAGDLLVLTGGAANNNANGVITGVTQANVTWTLAVHSLTNMPVGIWYGVAGASAGTSVTVQLAGNLTTTWRANVSEWSGTASSSVNGPTNSSSGNSTTADAGSVTPVASRNVLVIALKEATGAVSAGPSNGFTALSTSGGSNWSAAYLVVATANTSYNTAWTVSSGTWEADIASFYAPAPASGACTLSLLGVGTC